MKRMRLAAAMAVVGLMLAEGSAWANNLVVTNAMVRGSTTNTAKVKFDVAWENSWRYTNVNHDAAWVFFKVQTEGDVSNNWQHVKLEGLGTNPPGYSTGTGTGIELIVPDDRMGLFVRRSAEGSGPVSVQNAQAIWNFATNGLTSTNNVRMQVLAVEMVYVPEGSFYVGSGGTEPGSFTDGSWVSGATIPFRITNETALLMTNAAGYLCNTLTNVAVLSNAFPKGYAAFYCMKYEITQGQYRDFLNTLTRSQQSPRVTSLVASNFALGTGGTNIINGNGVRCPSAIPGIPTNVVFGCDGNANMVFNENNDAMDRGCNYISGVDGCAFADWAGLRPMTELEFEKACRGPLTPVTNEYAWGSTNITKLTAEAGYGTGTSTVSTLAGANCCYNNGLVPSGPTRAGIFATGSSSRTNAGASYWGIMELSGNLWEWVVAVGTATGRGFTGLNGDGQLTTNGVANVSAWPTDGDGANARGGFWGDNAPYACVSDRGRPTVTSWQPYMHSGWRAVRAAPFGP